MQALNGYAGASPEFAPFVETDSSGDEEPQRIRACLLDVLTVVFPLTTHCKAAVGKTSQRLGLGFQASYT